MSGFRSRTSGFGLQGRERAKTRNRGATALAVLVVSAMATTAIAADVAALAARLKANDPIERTRAACEAADLGGAAKDLIPQLAAMLGDATAVPGDVCGDRGRWWKGKDGHGAVPETTPGERAAEALAAIGIASFDPVLRSLRSPLWHARRNAAWALGALDDRRAVEPLQAALRDGEPPVRRTAAWALGALDDEQAVSALVAALKDRDPETRATAAWALGAIGDSRATEPLGAALEDASSRVRAQAAWALGAIDDPRAVPGLMRALNDADARVRSQSAWALGAIGDPRAAGALASALKDSDVNVRRKAAWALGTIER